MRFVSLIFMLLFLFWGSWGSVVHAAEEVEILTGRPMIWSTAVFEPGKIIYEMTDGDNERFVFPDPKNDTRQVVWTTLDRTYDITKHYFAGNRTYNYFIRYYDAQGSLIKQFSCPCGEKDKVYVHGVKTIAFVNAYYGLPNYIYDVRVWGIPLSAPYDVSVSVDGLGYDHVTLGISAKEADTIRIFRDNIEIATVSGSETEYHDYDIEPDTEYTYRIVAVNPEGETESESITVTTIGQIRNLRVTHQTKEQVTLAWDRSPAAESYHVAVSGDRNENIQTTETSVTITALQPGQEYKVQVSGYHHLFGIYGTSATQVFIPSIDVPPPTDMPSVMDVMSGSWSFASNFWWLFVLGAALVLTPKLFSTANRSVPSSSTEKRAEREKKREVRLKLRKEG